MVGRFSVKSPKGDSMHEIGGNVVDIFQWDGDALKFRVLSFDIGRNRQRNDSGTVGIVR